MTNEIKFWKDNFKLSLLARTCFVCLEIFALIPVNFQYYVPPNFDLLLSKHCIESSHAVKHTEIVDDDANTRVSITFPGVRCMQVKFCRRKVAIVLDDPFSMHRTFALDIQARTVADSNSLDVA